MWGSMVGSNVNNLISVTMTGHFLIESEFSVVSAINFCIHIEYVFI